MATVNIYIPVLNNFVLKIAEEIRNLRNPNIKIWLYKEVASDSQFKKLINTWRDKIFIDDNYRVDNSINYFRWDISRSEVTMLYCGLKWLIPRSDQTQFCVLSENNTPRKSIILFKDAIQHEHLPEKFIKIPSYENLQDILEYCKAQGVFEFSLEDTNKFSLQNGISPIQGAKVYEEKSTKYLWYLDMLHKTHYEVFNSTGKTHLGEADLNGIIDYRKKDKGKHAIK